MRKYGLLIQTLLAASLVLSACGFETNTRFGKIRGDWTGSKEGNSLSFSLDAPEKGGNIKTTYVALWQRWNVVKSGMIAGQAYQYSFP